jgi:hypothetical protein
MRFEAVTVVVLQIQGLAMLLSFADKYLLKSLFMTLKMKAL